MISVFILDGDDTARWFGEVRRLLEPDATLFPQRDSEGLGGAILGHDSALIVTRSEVLVRGGSRQVVQRTQAQWPFCVLVILVARGAERGIVELSVRGMDRSRTLLLDPDRIEAGIRSALEIAETLAIREAILSRIRVRSLRDATALLPVFARLAGPRGSVPAVADVLGIAPRSLHERCIRAGLPSPGKLRGWCGILRIARRLDAGHPVKRIVRRLGFSTDPALRNQVRRYTGRTVSDLRKDGAFETTLRLFAIESGTPSFPLPRSIPVPRSIREEGGEGRPGAPEGTRPRM